MHPSVRLVVIYGASWCLDTRSKIPPCHPFFLQGSIAQLTEAGTTAVRMLWCDPSAFQWLLGPTHSDGGDGGVVLTIFYVLFLVMPFLLLKEMKARAQKHVRAAHSTAFLFCSSVTALTLSRVPSISCMPPTPALCIDRPTLYPLCRSWSTLDTLGTRLCCG